MVGLGTSKFPRKIWNFCSRNYLSSTGGQKYLFRKRKRSARFFDYVFWNMFSHAVWDARWPSSPLPHPPIVACISCRDCTKPTDGVRVLLFLLELAPFCRLLVSKSSALSSSRTHLRRENGTRIENFTIKNGELKKTPLPTLASEN